MLDILVEKIGMAPWFASYVLLPVLIFSARILDVLFYMFKRERLPIIIEGIKTFSPDAFYTVESVKSSAENQVDNTKRRFALLNLLTSKRK